MLFPNVILIDSPGLGDPNLPIPQWLALYRDQVVKEVGKADLVLIVIEKMERVRIDVLEVFTILNKAMEGIDSHNIAIIWNKATVDDEPKDVL